MVFKAIFGNTSNEFIGGIPGLGGVENGKEKILTYSLGNGDVMNFHATKPWEKDGSKTLFYYEVRVLSPGQKGSIGIGLTELDKCSGNQQPGWFKGSFGYHADDGGGFENGNVIGGFGPAWAAEDTVVGCGIDFAKKNIFFMLPNGKKQILPITSTFPKKVFPIVGMHSPNEKVAVNLGELPFVHDIEPRPYRYPSAFQLEHAECSQSYTELTLTSHVTASLQANAAFPRLVNVQPYFELRIVALKAFEHLTIGFSDQRFKADQCLGQMQNSFAWHNTGNLGANFGSISKTSPFKQGDVIGCGVAFDTFNMRRIFVTLNGEFLQFLDSKVSPAMDCFPTVSFAGKDIKVSYNFGTSAFVWDLSSEWPKFERRNFILSLPKETLEHIVSYTAHSMAFTNLCLARVNKMFNNLSTDSVIWRRLALAEFQNQNPNVKIRDWHKYCKKRIVAERKSSDPHPIENCSFGYECPLLLENLEVSQHSDDVRSCNKCNKDVYIVSSADQIKFQISLGRCVAFRVVQLRKMLLGDVAETHL
jgi:hypothetical protein